MGTWIVNEENSINIITFKDVSLSAFYAPAGSSAYTPIAGSFTKVGDRYYLNHTFDTLGSYIVRVVDTNANIADQYASIDVVSAKATVDGLESVQNAIDSKVATKGDVYAAKYL